MEDDTFKPASLGNIDSLEEAWAMFITAALKAFREQDDQLRAPGNCVFTAKITVTRSGDGFTITSETNEKFPGRVKGALTAVTTRDGLKIFSPVQINLPGVIRAVDFGASTKEATGHE